MGALVTQMLDFLGVGALPTTFPELILFCFKLAIAGAFILYVFGTMKYWTGAIFGEGRRL